MRAFIMRGQMTYYCVLPTERSRVSKGHGQRGERAGRHSGSSEFPQAQTAVSRGNSTIHRGQLIDVVCIEIILFRARVEDILTLTGTFCGIHMSLPYNYENEDSPRSFCLAGM